MIHWPCRLFVTGTDTSVGKTVLSTLLAHQLNAHYWKPIQSGLEDETDSQWVSRWIGEDRVLKERYRLKAPMSPDQSAKRENKHLQLSDFLLSTHSALVIEGAGGVLVPINKEELMIDLMTRFNLPVVIAARSGLGTLNHTLLTIEALKKRGLHIFGICLIGEKHPENRKTLKNFTDVPILLELDWVKDWNSCRLDDLYMRSLGGKENVVV